MWRKQPKDLVNSRLPGVSPPPRRKRTINLNGAFRAKKNAAGGARRVPPSVWVGRRGARPDQNRRSTFCSACEARDSAVDARLWRVCSASSLAPSSLVSALVSLSAPV